MKDLFRLFIVGVLLLGSSYISAQDSTKVGYKFEKIYDLEATSVKNQYRSGTCWSFSGMSFLESEVLKATGKVYDFSEMFVVRNCYSDKATKYVRLHGSLNFGPGGSFEDDLYSWKNYGIVPDEAYNGLHYGEKKHVHAEMDAVLKAYVGAVIENSNKKLTPVWHDGFEGILDAYLGKYPDQFTYEGKEYTPKSFAKTLGINPDDYIVITSFSHHPYYSKFILEVPDNWVWGEVYNVPLEDLKEIMHTSLKEGHSFGWASDVSEKGFSFRNGIAIVPETDIEEMSDLERSKWSNLDEKERSKEFYSFEEPVPQKKITQEMRQKEFDNYSTTDDHGMHITGMYKDQNGTIYYKVKNSWDTDNVYDGYFYASESFVLLKTTNIMINKNTLPKDLKKKLGIN